jgi:hypothetical protein
MLLDCIRITPFENSGGVSSQSFRNVAGRGAAGLAVVFKVFHSPILDLAVGLFFAYAMLSLICTALNEWIVALTQLRARSLHTAVLRLLDERSTGLGTALYQHPLIDCMTAAGGGRPDYLCPRLVAAALADILVGPHATSAGWKRAAHALPPCRLRRTLLLLLADTGAEHSAPPLAEWFEGSMLHLSSWYKRRMQLISCVVALAICIVLDADTCRMAQALWGTGLWETPGHLTSWNAPGQLTGWLLTAVAVSRGAPFWFDVLRRLSGARDLG